MNTHVDDSGTTFLARSEIFVAASPGQVYGTVSDLTRSGEWSVECRGGQWVEGAPGTVGAIFRGDNERGRDTVAWAPVIRGPWQTEAEVLEAVPGSTFRWVILNSARGRQESVWSFEIEPAEGGSLLVHHYRLGRLTEGLSKIFSGLDGSDRERFVKEWNAKLSEDIQATVERIKTVIEKD
ncbi:SRPBCC family protein [Streptomyces sp. NPDC058576]|uniref:SRPBCC family protein n=1 Tax=Streptomyces sp. NPDC058576 TaxID=3346547 RepID=UPI00364E841F